jgi:hypothetical protein
VTGAYVQCRNTEHARLVAAAIDAFQNWGCPQPGSALEYEIETARLIKVFERIDIVVCDELSTTCCTRDGKPLRGRCR